jgi:putative ABC transport system substrate-binding protein
MWLFSRTPAGPNHASLISNINSAAQAIGVELSLLEARGPEGFDAAFARMVNERVGAALVVGEPAFDNHRARMADLAFHHRLPSMHTLKQSVEAGGLMSYGPSTSDILAECCDLCGQDPQWANPSDLPIEQPTKFELVFNLETANALGITSPQACLRADEVLE